MKSFLKKDNNLRELLGELFLIIGGFMLAETIIKQFLSLSANALPWWVLPLFSILMIITALDFRNHKNSLIEVGILPTTFLGGSILLIVLMKNNFITNIFFLWSIFILSLIVIIVRLIVILFRKKKIGDKNGALF